MYLISHHKEVNFALLLWLAHRYGIKIYSELTARSQHRVIGLFFALQSSKL